MEVGPATVGLLAGTTGEDQLPGINGGIARGPSDYPHGIRITIEVDDIDAAMATAVENGAKVVRKKMEFDDFYLAYLVDPVGLVFGLRQNSKSYLPAANSSIRSVTCRDWLRNLCNRKIRARAKFLRALAPFQSIPHMSPKALTGWLMKEVELP